ncbi:MAG: radical SAM protein [Nanobdellota archaeon]
MKHNNYFSYNKGNLCKGCKLCVKGRKTVIYITGLCPRDCFYCPLSEEKKNHDVVYANEKKVSINNISEEIIEETRLCSSKGAGITGGDPLLKMERTLEVIRKLKDYFGKDFHIHLYTSLDLIDEKKMSSLYEAGLDEIRIHPDLYDRTFWYKIKIINYFKGDKGIEIPAMPGRGKSIKDLYFFSKSFIDFFNINEFEYSDNNCDRLHSKGFYCRNEDTYAIKGSKELGKRLLDKLDGKIPVHFCTAKLKDATQISKRLKLRAKNVCKKYDIVNEEGLLIKGRIKGNLSNIIKYLKNLDVPEDLFEKKEGFVVIAAWVLEDIFDDLPFNCDIVTEYPTSDRMIVDVIPLE